MGKVDVSVKHWLKNKERFADLFNGVLFNGRRIVLPQDLCHMDSESDIIITDKKGKDKAIQRYRDVVMSWKGEISLAVLAVEAQDKVHYAMPVRTMLYDSLTYTEQIKKQWDALDKSDKEMATEAEFFSGFRKDDKVVPVVTILFYHGEDEWDGPTELYQILDVSEEESACAVMKKYVNNYKINLLDASCVEDVERFQTDLQIIFNMLKYRRDKYGMKQFKESHSEELSHIPLDTAYVMKALLKVDVLKDIEKYRGQEEINMCKAFDDMMKDERDEGKAEGKAEGIAEEREKNISVLVDTLKEFGCSMEDARHRLIEKMNLSDEKAREYIDMYWGS